MGKKKGECTVCDRTFELDAEGNVPSHTKAIVGECCGSNVPAVPVPSSVTGHRVSGVLCQGCGKAACAGILAKYRKLKLDRTTPKRKGTCHACKATAVNVRRYRAVRERREQRISYAAMMVTNSVPPGRGGHCG